MKSTVIRRALTAAAASALLLVGAGLTPATAKDEPVVQSSETTVKMEYLGFDAKVAKKNGYDIRTDRRGVKYSIPETEPKDSMNGAVYIPKDAPSSGHGDPDGEQHRLR